MGPGPKLSQTLCGYYADVVRTSIHYNPGLKNSQMLKITVVPETFPNMTWTANTDSTALTETLVNRQTAEPHKPPNHANR